MQIVNRVAVSFALASAIATMSAVPPAVAEPAAAPTASPSPSPAPSSKPAVKVRRLNVTAEGSFSAVDQQFVGSGTMPIEGPGFALRSAEMPALAPANPYDLTTGAPLTTGIGFSQSILITPTYLLTPGLKLSATVGFGSINGNGNVASYWGEQTLPQLNPSLGQRYVSIPPAFSTHNGEDSVRSNVLAVESGVIGSPDGSRQVRGGWLDLLQNESQVFAQPAALNTVPRLGWTLPQTVSDGAPAIAGFDPQAPSLPLHGVDAYYRHDLTSLELTSAALPALPGTGAQLSTGSLVINHGAGLSYGFAVAHVTTGGDPILVPVLYGGIGGPGVVFPSPQGDLAFSTLGGQRVTIVGANAAIPLGGAGSADLKVGYSQYAADGTAFGGKTAQGGYYYGKIRHGFADFEIAAEAIRFDPTYAPIQLPYGTLENVWSPAFAYPRGVAPGYYSLVDTSVAGPNREGFRLSGTTRLAGVDVRLAYTSLDQVQTTSTANAYQPGFVEPFFSPQVPGAASYGREQRSAASLAWHPAFVDVALDFTDAVLTRSGRNPGDAVNLEVPGGTLTLSRKLGSRFLASAGVGRSAIIGAYDTSGPANVDLTENVLFAGLEYARDRKLVYHLQYRLYSTHGSAAALFGNSPAFHGPQLILEQRFSL